MCCLFFSAVCPVIMKLEATDEESKIDYHPIER